MKNFIQVIWDIRACGRAKSYDVAQQSRASYLLDQTVQERRRHVSPTRKLLCKATQRDIPGDLNLHQPRCENIKIPAISQILTTKKKKTPIMKTCSQPFRQLALQAIEGVRV